MNWSSKVRALHQKIKSVCITRTSKWRILWKLMKILPSKACKLPQFCTFSAPKTNKNHMEHTKTIQKVVWAESQSSKLVPCLSGAVRKHQEELIVYTTRSIQKMRIELSEIINNCSSKTSMNEKELRVEMNRNWNKPSRTYYMKQWQWCKLTNP